MRSCLLQVASGTLLLVLLGGGVRAQTQRQEIPDSEAAAHVGETVTVRGTVANVYTSRAGNTFINFGRPYPNQVFTAVIFKERSRLFPNVHSLEGQEVRVTGEIRLYKGKPEIILESPSQLKY
jgi:DNA/RNA endonuclease YhcR with UshA esterase domain